MGWVKGLEPSTYGTTTRRSSQLSYTHHVRHTAKSIMHARSRHCKRFFQKILSSGKQAFSKPPASALPMARFADNPMPTCENGSCGDARGSSAAIEEYIGHLPGTVCDEELYRLIDGRDERAEHRCREQRAARHGAAGTKGLRCENAQNEVLGEVRGLPHEKIRDPFAREAERAQKALHRLDDGEAQ